MSLASALRALRLDMSKPRKAALGKPLLHLIAIITQVQSLMELAAGLGAKRLGMRKSGKAAVSTRLFLHSVSFQLSKSKKACCLRLAQSPSASLLKAQTWPGRIRSKTFLHIMPLEDVT